MEITTVKSAPGKPDVVEKVTIGAAAKPLPTVEALRMIPWAALRPSPLNPRKARNAEADAELAQSIKQEGLLENLVARPRAGSKTEYELIAGERRHRAIGMLIRDKAPGWTETIELPVRVREVNDRDLLLIGTIENVQRESLEPLEEAAAFKALKAQGVIVVDIAKMIGKTRRFVEKRLSLVERLDEKAQKALAAGELNVTQALAITQAPQARQADLVKAIVKRERGEKLETEKEVLAAVRATLIPTARAWFEPKLYKGPLVEHPDKKGVMCFDDAPQFERLQKEFMNNLLDELRKKHHWVAVSERNYDLDPEWYRYDTDKTNPKAGALVVVCDVERSPHFGKYKIHTGVVEKNNPARGGKAKQSAPARSSGPSEFFNAFQFASSCRYVKVKALQVSLLNDELAALRLAALNLLLFENNDRGRNGSVCSCIQTGYSPALDDEDSDAASPGMAAIRKLLGTTPRDEPAKLWAKIKTLDKPGVVRLIAQASAALASIEAEIGKSADREIDVAIALEAAPPNVSDVWSWSKDSDAFLKESGRKQLYWLCRDLGIRAKSDAEPKELRKLLAGAKPPAGYVPPWLRMLTAAQLEETLGKVGKSPTIPMPKNAARELAKDKHMPIAKAQAIVSRGVVVKKAAPKKAAKKKGGK